ncbi:MAG: YfcE family phosphodiesterase [Bacillota bacterium]|nr:YfcE family phosphodiesterase [Bacillota bacterium]
MKTVCIISDSHRMPTYVEKVRYELCKEADVYIHCGDIFYNDPKECLDFLVVQGNHDYHLGLPYFRIVEVEEVRIFVIHGEFIYFMEDAVFEKILEINRCDILVMGHTHVAEIRYLSHGKLFCNPGSVCWPQDEFSGSYLTLQIDGKKIEPCIHRFPLDPSLFLF